MASSERYDRQIRLWGEGGQAALSCASVLVLGSSATATETLKNLVLPGIGSYTIVDGATCAETHSGNFFVSSTDDSSSAANAASNLAELNPSVQGSFIAAPAESFLTDLPAATTFVSRYSLVIAAQLGLGHAVLLLISAACAAARIPLLLVRSYGGLGLVRLQHPGGTASVLNSREDAMPDLRLRRPFEALSAIAHSARASLRDPDAARRVPFVLILCLALQDYRASHFGELPTSRAEKDDFRRLVAGFRPEGLAEDAANFEEALKSSHLRLCYGPMPTLSSNVEALFADARSDPAALRRRPEARVSEASIPLPSPVRVVASVEHSRGSDLTPLTPTSRCEATRLQKEENSFWVHVAAVRAFFEESGELPVTGSLPDMDSGTEEYVAIQHVYFKKAADDATLVLRFALDIAERRGIASDAPADLSTVSTFCKDACRARVLRGRDLSAELNQPSESGFLEAARNVGALDQSMSNSAAAYYPLFRAVDLFYKEYRRYPGSDPGCKDSDLVAIQDLLTRVKRDLGGAHTALWRDEAEEMVRFANAELHNVAALIGGIASQEAVKIITRQFVPLNNTLIVNFSNMTSMSFSA